jgi:internalin A
MSKLLHLFVSYAPQDIDYRDDFIKHLASLRRSGKVKIWSDNQIEPGVDWDEETKEHLRQADIVALLISSDFMNSDKIWDNELQQSLDRREKGEAVMLIPILIKPCEIGNTVLGKIQRLPRDQQAVSSHSNKDEAWYKIAVEINAVVDNFQKTVASVAASAASPNASGSTQQFIGSKNVISGSVIIVGGDLIIGDRN